MFTLKLEKREKNLRGRQLRNKGIIPVVLYGKHLEESISMQLPVHEAQKFLHTNFIGTKVELEIEDIKHLSILKEIKYTPGTYKVEHLSFQALVAGEKLKSVAKIMVIGKEKVREGSVLQILDDIAYSAFPADLIDRIEVDVARMRPGDALTVGDLEISKNKRIELITASDSVVISVALPKKATEEEETSEAQISEPALVSEEKEK